MGCLWKLFFNFVLLLRCIMVLLLLKTCLMCFGFFFSISSLADCCTLINFPTFLRAESFLLSIQLLWLVVITSPYSFAQEGFLIEFFLFSVSFIISAKHIICNCADMSEDTVISISLLSDDSNCLQIWNNNLLLHWYLKSRQTYHGT